jgi:hypothetical protein
MTLVVCGGFMSLPSTQILLVTASWLQLCIDTHMGFLFIHVQYSISFLVTTRQYVAIMTGVHSYLHTGHKYLYVYLQYSNYVHLEYTPSVNYG